jgi:hypothetical protein
MHTHTCIERERSHYRLHLPFSFSHPVLVLNLSLSIHVCVCVCVHPVQAGTRSAIVSVEAQQVTPKAYKCMCTCTFSISHPVLAGWHNRAIRSVPPGAQHVTAKAEYRGPVKFRWKRHAREVFGLVCVYVCVCV